MNFDVFISYPNQDRTTAEAACAALEADGIKCWIAPRDVAPGTECAAAIIDALDRCRAMVLIFSSHTNHSRQIHREVQRALDHDKQVVPLRIENVQPVQSLAYYLGPVHWLDALTPPLDSHLKQLCVAVKALLQAPPGHHQAGDLRQTLKSGQPSAGPIPSARFGFRAALGAIVAIAVLGAMVWLSPMSPTAVSQKPTPPPSQTSSVDGTFGGTMECAKLPWTAAPLHAAVSLSVKDGNAIFVRDVYADDGKRKAGVEQGTGALDADGMLQLTTSWVSQTSRFDGSYAGRLSAAGGNLSGQQVLLVNNVRHERPCTIIVQKVGEL